MKECIRGRVFEGILEGVCEIVRERVREVACESGMVFRYADLRGNRSNCNTDRSRLVRLLLLLLLLVLLLLFLWLLVRLCCMHRSLWLLFLLRQRLLLRVGLQLRR